LDVVAYVLLASVLGGIVVSSASMLHRSLANPAVWGQMRRGRLVSSLLALGGALSLFLFLPLPCRLLVPALAQVKNAQRVYVSTAGTLANSVAEGVWVRNGQVIAQLEDAELSRKLADLTGQHQRLAARVKHLEAVAAIDSFAAAEWVVAKEMETDAAERLNQHQREINALELAAPSSGMVIPPPPTARAPSEPSGQLPAWSGTPLESHNNGCFLPRGTLLCTIGDPAQMESVAYVDESDVELVRVGQQVRVWFEVGRGVVVSGEVAEIAEGDVEFVPNELAAQKELASRADSSGNPRALETSYQVRVHLNYTPVELISGARGRAKIKVEPQTLARRLYRAVRRVLSVQS
jgi:putative peptide zinc metalloprotease protein